MKTQFSARSKQAWLVASGDLRQAVNQEGWAEQAKMEAALAAALPAETLPAKKLRGKRAHLVLRARGLAFQPRVSMTTFLVWDIVESHRLRLYMNGSTSTERNTLFYKTVLEPLTRVIGRFSSEFGGGRATYLGDGGRREFLDPEAAVLCGLAIQDDLRVRPIRTPIGPVQLRIGVHIGVAFWAHGNCCSEACDKAFRVSKVATGGMVAVSSELHEMIREKVQRVAFLPLAPCLRSGLGPKDTYQAVRTN